MKKHFLLFVLAIFCVAGLVSCGLNTEKEPTYINVDSLAEHADINSVSEEEYNQLKSIDLALLPEDIAKEYRDVLANIVTYRVLYVVDNCVVSAYISLPNDYEEHKYPLVIYNRGGNGNFSAMNADATAIYASALNCVVIASNYREATPGTGFDEFGGADVNDVVFWIDLVPELGFVDRESVYMIGESRGGMQTCLALLNDDKHIIKAAACISGVYDVTGIFNSRTDMQNMLIRRIGGTPDELPDEYEKRSAINFAENINTPLIIIHSVDDTQVPYDQATRFVAVLEERGKTVKFETRNDGYHSITSSSELRNIFKQLKELVK